MAKRELRIVGDDILRKRSKEVININDSIRKKLDDMLETMYASNGVGLAGPQVGILRRLVVIDVGEGPYKLINPVIENPVGSYLDVEGCLSVPEENGVVERPEELDLRYLDENGIERVVHCSGLMARCVCHEIDHLNGVLFIDKVRKDISVEDLYKLEEEKENEQN